MKIFLSIFILIAGVAVFAYSCGGSAANPKTDTTGQATPVVSGAELYADNCVVCHGMDGKAGMSGATDLSTSLLSHEHTIEVIANGRNGMRAFSSQFSKEEIEAITKHVESLRK